MINILNMGTVTSTFGDRDAPTAGASTNHNGIDIVLKNANVPAVAGGAVTGVGYNSSSGNYVKITDANGYEHTYAHLAGRPNLNRGDTVNTGDVIGIQGSTGVSTGVHLHYAVKKGTTYIDPEDFLKGETDTDINFDTENSSTGGVAGKLSEFVKGDILSPIFVTIIILGVGAIGVYFGMKAFDISIPSVKGVLK